MVDKQSVPDLIPVRIVSIIGLKRTTTPQGGETTMKTQEIFELAQILTEEGYDFWFNAQDDYDENIDDEEYEFVLETQTGELIGSRAAITVSFRRDMDGLQLLDMRPARGKVDPEDADGVLHTGLTAKQALEIIIEFFEAEKAQ